MLKWLQIALLQNNKNTVIKLALIGQQIRKNCNWLLDPVVKLEKLPISGQMSILNTVAVHLRAALSFLSLP